MNPEELAKIEKTAVMIRASGIGGQQNETILYLLAEVRSLTEERDRLLADRDRLDWIEAAHADVGTDITPGCWRVDTLNTNYQRATLRDAIDAARGAQGDPPA
jgi:hypothetical protein